MIHKELINKGVLLALVFAISALFLVMIQDFLMPLFMAGLFSAMLKPTHSWLCRKTGGRKHFSSTLIIIGIVLLVLIPLGLLIGVVAGQALSVSQSVSPWVEAFIHQPSAISAYVEKLPYYNQLFPYRALLIEKAGMLVGMISTFLINSLSSVTKMTVNAIFGSVIMLYVMFFFLSMGEVLLRKMMYFLPLRDQDEQLLLRRFTSVAKATLKSTLIIGLVQGLVCGTAFALAGIQGPVFWGTLMAVLSIIPAFGTCLVWGPALLIALLQGDFQAVLLLAALCGLLAGNLDNLLRPRLVGKDTKMHDLFVLFGSLGGIGMFGILGILIGPIIAALFITIWEIYGTAFANWLPAVHFLRGPDQEEQAAARTCLPSDEIRHPADETRQEVLEELIRDMRRRP